MSKRGIGIAIEGGAITVIAEGDKIAVMHIKAKGGIRVLGLLALRLRNAALRWDAGDDVVESLSDDRMERGAIDAPTVDCKRKASAVTLTTADSEGASLAARLRIGILDATVHVAGDATPELLFALGDDLWRRVEREAAVDRWVFWTLGPPFAKALAEPLTSSPRFAGGL